MKSRISQIIVFILTMVTGYAGFRLFYKVSDQFPFSQELLLVFLGAIATVLITALLLGQQTELELKKEGQVLLLDQKSNTYCALIDHLGEIVETGHFDPEKMARLRILNHKLAMIGSAPVIQQFGSVLIRLDRAMQDKNINTSEKTDIMRATAKLTYYMRQDLLGWIADEDGNAVMENIIGNSNELED